MELRAFTPEQERGEAKQSCRLVPWLRRLAGAAAFALFLGAVGATAYLLLSIS